MGVFSFEFSVFSSQLSAFRQTGKRGLEATHAPAFSNPATDFRSASTDDNRFNSRTLAAYRAFK